MYRKMCCCCFSLCCCCCCFSFTHTQYRKYSYQVLIIDKIFLNSLISKSRSHTHTLTTSSRECLERSPSVFCVSAADLGEHFSLSLDQYWISIKEDMSEKSSSRSRVASEVTSGHSLCKKAQFTIVRILLFFSFKNDLVPMRKIFSRSPSISEEK